MVVSLGLAAVPLLSDEVWSASAPGLKRNFPSPTGRVSARQFGQYEVRNRLYFVRKHGLSLARCYLGLAIRLAMSVCSGLVRLDSNLFNRAFGNIEELIWQSNARPKKFMAKSPQL